MNAIERYEQRKKQIIEPAGNDEAVLGATIAKHIIGISEADKSERNWGRVKSAFRLGAFGLLGAKVLTDFGARTSKLVNDTFELGRTVNVPEIGGSWFVPSVVALYGISRVSRFVQNQQQTIAMDRRDAFRDAYVPTADYGDIATGAINTLGDFYDTRSISSSINYGVSTSLHEFLHNIQPTIPEALK